MEKLLTVEQAYNLIQDAWKKLRLSDFQLRPGQAIWNELPDDIAWYYIENDPDQGPKLYENKNWHDSVQYVYQNYVRDENVHINS